MNHAAEVVGDAHYVGEVFPIDEWVCSNLGAKSDDPDAWEAHVGGMQRQFGYAHRLERLGGAVHACPCGGTLVILDAGEGRMSETGIEIVKRGTYALRGMEE